MACHTTGQTRPPKSLGKTGPDKNILEKKHFIIEKTFLHNIDNILI